MTYETVVSVTQIAALFLFMAVFAGVLVYAFWPGNKARFDRAARMPLRQDPDEPIPGGSNGDKT